MQLPPVFESILQNVSVNESIIIITVFIAGVIAGKMINNGNPGKIRAALPSHDGDGTSDACNTLEKGWCPEDFSTAYNDTSTKTEQLLKETNKQLINSLADTIRHRRSVFPKDFLKSDPNTKVPLAWIEEALSAANWSPTHGKTEPWRFVVCAGNAIHKVLDIRDEVCTKLYADDTAKLERHKKKMKSKREQWPRCSAIIFIIVKRVPNRKGKYMPEWEDIAAVSCAVQNLHLMFAARRHKGVGGYWTSGGQDSWLASKELRDLLKAENHDETIGNDLVLGAFLLGMCSPAKIEKYSSKRGNISDKVMWLHD
eukprot:g3018.t1